MSNKSNELTELVAGGLTQEEIDSLKKRYGPLKLVTVKGNPDQYFWFRKPDKKILSAASSQALQNPVASLEIYFNNCLVHGDKKAIEDVDVFSSLMIPLNELIEQRETEVKNF
jgi:hypothetical protein